MNIKIKLSPGKSCADMVSYVKQLASIQNNEEDGYQAEPGHLEAGGMVFSLWVLAAFGLVIWL